MTLFWHGHFATNYRTIEDSYHMFAQNQMFRKHATGNFGRLLFEIIRDPAMIAYLDNNDSRKGKPNENLARELMELHVLGVDGGYTQADVTELAKILTGWTIHRPGQPERAAAAERGGAVFLPTMHEPGDKTLLGKRYLDEGADEADAAIEDLVRRPAAARFIATRLAQHFIADDPPPAAVAALAETFTKTDGDLSAVYARLIDLDAAWAGAGKYRSPYDWVVAIFRAFAADGPGPAQRAAAAINQLGQRLYFAPSPAGWPDDDASWMAPEALLARVDYAEAIGRTKGESDPIRLADLSLGATLTAQSKFAIEHAPSRGDAVALLLVSPEFLRR
jgi:uncharacterized protein (DUF1800 family)